MAKCPIVGCEGTRGEEQIMCRDCWFTVSKKTRDEVWTEYRRERGSVAHRTAVRAAIREARAAMKGEEHGKA